MENFKHLRIKLGLTRNQMADLLGCTLGQFAMAEGGHRKLPVKSQEVLFKINQAFENSIEQLDGLTEDEPNLDTQKFFQKAAKQLKKQLNAHEILLEKLLEKREKLKLQLLFSDQVILKVFFSEDSIEALSLQIIQRKARMQLNQVIVKIHKQKLAILATQTQLNRLQET